MTTTSAENHVLTDHQMDQPIIFQQFPQLAQTIPWISLGEFPTPIERLTNLENETGLDNLWIKRDDLSSKIYGGNKVRTLEFSLADALKNKAELLFAYSALGSNWPLACVIHARMHAMPVDVFFLPYPLDVVKRKNLALTRQLARRVFEARSLFTFPFLLGFYLYTEKRRCQVYLMPPGGVSPLTTLGYVNATLELERQCENGDAPKPDYIFCPLGSGGTAAGISIGLELLGWSTKVVAVRVVDLIVGNKYVLNRLIKKTIAFMRSKGVGLPLSPAWGANIEIVHHYFGQGYGRPTEQGEQSIKLLHLLENQLLDSTYTGKTFAALLDLAQKQGYRNRNLLFWHTLNSRPLNDVPGKLRIVSP